MDTKTVMVSFILGLTSLASLAAQPGADPLFQAFQEPPSQFRPMPLWYWGGEIQADEVKRQVDEYIRQGASGAIVYPGIGLRTPFLSEAWWQIWAQLLPYAREKGFKLGWNAEFQHPSGDARDIWMDPPDQSRVLEGHPEYRLKRLDFVERQVSGPGRVRFEALPDPIIAVAARIKGSALDPQSLVDLSSFISGQRFEAELGEGNWLLTFYYPEEVAARHEYRVDPLNADAARRFIEVTLGELERRFKEYLGSTFTVIMLDSEGGYGGPLVWTPGFFESFKRKKNYDLKQYLPLLVRDGGAITPKIRNDYFQVVSEVYLENFWKPIVDWCRKRGIALIVQDRGSQLRDDPAAGDHMMIQREMTYPFMENLLDLFRNPREFKEPASIAHFENKFFWCECQLIQGTGSFISPQKMRYGANAVAAWGVNYWSQNTNYASDLIDHPPDMGPSQPHWKFFRHYADYVRRMGFMNDQGKHVADILIYRPIASTVASYRYLDQSEETFDQIEADYNGVMQLLIQRQRDFDIVDDYYLEQAVIEQGILRIGDERFYVLILPSTGVISRRSLAKIQEFYRAGGTVIAFGALPHGSTEEGWDDPEVFRVVRAIFGADPATQERLFSRNPNGGRAYFLPQAFSKGTLASYSAEIKRSLLGGPPVRHDYARDLESLAELLAEIRPADFEVLKGAKDHLLYLHRMVEDRDLYWVANDTDEPKNVVISLAAQGKPELWDAASGTRKELVYWVAEGRTVLSLQLEAWDGAYVVFRPDSTPKQIVVASTNLQNYVVEESTTGSTLKGRVPAWVEKIYVEGQVQGRPFKLEKMNADPIQLQVISPRGWKFHPVAPRVTVRYARERLVPKGTGRAAGFAEAAYNDRIWELSWLSRERWTIRDWWVIGPFPNPDHHGFNEAYPPERGVVDLEARFEDVDGQKIGWQWYHSEIPWVNLKEALGLGDREGVQYAFTYIFSPSDQEVQAILATTNAKLWVNEQLIHALHAMPRYFEIRDAFADKMPVKLKSGWNRILIKVENCPFARWGLRERSFFSFRLADRNGRPVQGLLVASKPQEPDRLIREFQQKTQDLERWYRFEVPPGTKAFLVPTNLSVWAVYLNGNHIQPDANGKVALPLLSWDQANLIAVEMPASSEWLDYAVFESGDSEYQLGSWTWTGLSYFSGEAIYEKDFDLDSRLLGHTVELDLGEVGVTAEVWLNGRKVGERVWRPFRLDVTDALRSGRNHLKIAVTNSDANARAEVNLRRYLEQIGNIPHMDRIDPNGLIGPIRLLPYLPVELALPHQ